VRRDLLVAMEEVDRVASPLDFDALADEATGYRVAGRLKTDEIVLGHDARDARLLLERALACQGHQLSAFARKPLDRPLMRRAVEATVRDRRIPLIELGLKVHEIDKVCPGRQFRFTYFTPDSTLPLVCAR